MKPPKTPMKSPVPTAIKHPLSLGTITNNNNSNTSPRLTPVRTRLHNNDNANNQI